MAEHHLRMVCEVFTRRFRMVGQPISEGGDRRMSLLQRGCVKIDTLSFFCTKPRLSQARALLFPKVVVPLGIQKISLWERYTFVLTYTIK